MQQLRIRQRSQRELIRVDWRKNKWVYFLFLPVLAYYLIFRYAPMFGIVIGFQNFKPILGFGRSPWVGIENLVEFLTSHYAGRTIRNTLLISTYSIIFGFPMPIIFALLLNELHSAKYKKVVQTISYMPHFISMVVVCGMIRLFTGADGLINSVARLFGADFGNLLNSNEYYRPIYIISGIWQSVGWSSIIYLATLSSVDPSLYEAAAIDGAGRFRRVIHVTLPALVPIIMVQLIMRLGNLLDVGYEKTLLLYNPAIYENSDIISTYIYRYGLEGGKYGRGAIVGLFNSLINIVILVIANWGSRKLTEESLW